MVISIGFLEAYYTGHNTCNECSHTQYVFCKLEEERSTIDEEEVMRLQKMAVMRRRWMNSDEEDLGSVDATEERHKRGWASSVPTVVFN